jgi:hypothetical protein
LSDEQIESEMRKTAMWLNSKQAMIKWLEMLEGNTPISNYSMEGGGGLAAGLDMLGGGILSRVNAIRRHFGMPEYTGKENGK